MIVTDLNDRERKRYADQLEMMAKTAGEAAVALRAGDDTAVLVRLAVLGIGYKSLGELTEVFINATDVSIPNGPPRAHETGRSAQ